MKCMNRKFPKKILGESESISEEKRIQKVVQKSIDAFVKSESCKSLSMMEFILSQAKYIKKRWWIIQVVMLFFLWLFLKQTTSDYYTQRSIAVVAPLFVILFFPELWKNKMRNALEVECTTLYSLRQIYSARLILFGFIDFVFLSIFFASVLFVGKVAAWDLFIQFLIPFNITSCICFSTLYSKWINSELFAVFLCIVSTSIWVQIVLNKNIYNVIAKPIWFIVLIVSILMLICLVVRGQKKYLEIWEEKKLWN